MFNDVHFTGTVNLGNLVNSLVVLIGVITLYFRVKAKLAEHEQETGKKIETSIRKRLTRSKKVIPPATSDQGDDNSKTTG